MIFVSTGTVSFPFVRLVDAVINFYRKRPSEKLVIQSGPYDPVSPAKHIVIKPYFSFERMLSYYRSASQVISAAGEVSVFLILRNARKVPIFVPRLKKYKEHVDDQQLMIGRYLQKHNLAQVVLDISLLKQHLKTKKTKGSKIDKYLASQSPELRKLINNLDQVVSAL